MSRKNPIHPGEIIRHDCSELAYDLAKARQHENEIDVRRYELVLSRSTLARQG